MKRPFHEWDKIFYNVEAVYDPTSRYFYRFREEVALWLINNSNMQSWFHYFDGADHYIMFEDSETAMQFKLMWG